MQQWQSHACWYWGIRRQFTRHMLHTRRRKNVRHMKPLIRCKPLNFIYYSWIEREKLSTAKKVCTASDFLCIFLFRCIHATWIIAGTVFCSIALLWINNWYISLLNQLKWSIARLTIRVMKSVQSIFYGAH